MRAERPPPRPWASLLFGVALVACAFPDVLFLGRSLSPSLLGDFLDDAPPAASAWPAAPGRRARHGQGDLPGGVIMYETVVRGTAAALRAGDSPWWNRWSGCGIAGPEALSFCALSPISLLAALAGGGPLAVDLAHLLALALAIGCFHGALRCELGASSLAAAAGAAAYGFNGFSTSFLASQVAHPYLLAAPVLWALLRATRAPGAGPVLLAALAHAALLCATLVPVQLTCLFAVHVVVALVPRPDGGGARPGGAARRRALLAQAMALAGGGVATAWLWLPILHALTVFDVVQNYGTRAFDEAGLHHALTLLTPKHFWESHSGIVPPGAERHTSEYMVVPHVGLLFGALACHAGWRSPTTRGALLVLAFVLLRMFGLPPVTWLLEVLPGPRIVRWLYWGAALSLVVPMLVASGVDRLRAGRGSRLAGGAYAGAALLWVGLLALGVGLPTGWLFTAYVGATVALLVGGFLAQRRALKDGRVARWLALAAALELLAHQNHLRPARVDRLAPEPPYLARLRALAGEDRVASVGWAYVPAPEWGQALRLRTADTASTLTTGRYRALIGRAMDLPPTLLWAHASYDRDLSPDGAALDRLAVRAVVVGAGCRRALAAFAAAGYPVGHRDARRTVFVNPHALPRLRVARALAHGVRVPSRGPAWRDVAVTDDEGFLARARGLGVPAAPLAGGEPRRVQVVAERNDALEVDVDLPAPGVLVVADTWHPGWRATLDGAPVEVGVVDEALRGVLVPAGRHRVALRYAPRGRWPGLALGAAGLLACGALALRLGRLDPGAG